MNVPAVTAALSGEAGETGVRGMLHGPGRRILLQTLQTMMGSDRQLRSCRLRRTHFKPGRKLATYYDVSVTGIARPIPIAATWFTGEPPVDTELLAAGEEKIRRAGIPTGFEHLWSTDESGALLLVSAPLDPAFPHLHQLADPLRVGDVLASSGLYPARPIAYPAIRFVRYRPGQRQVLDYRGVGGRGFVVKLYRPGELADVARRVITFADLTSSTDVSGVAAIRPAAVLESADAMLFARISGTPLSRYLVAGHSQSRLRGVGQWMRAVHSLRADAHACFGERDLAGEVRAVGRACVALNRLRPDLGATAAAIVERAAERMAALEQESATLVHADLKVDHLLCGSEGVTVIDADRCAIADPALDVGKMLADLRWWAWVKASGGADAATAALLAGYGAAGPRLARARLYAQILLVKMAGRRISLARPDWAAQTEALIALAAQPLDAGVAA